MLPLETRVTLYIFSRSARDVDPITVLLDAEQDRQTIVDHVVESGGPRGKTALWDTVAMAFDEAERLIRDRPGRTVCVGLYTDFDVSGDDEVSKLTQEDVEQRYGKLIRENKDLYMFGVKIGPGSAIGPWPSGQLGIPVPIRLDTRRVVLKSPVLDPAPAFDLRILGYTPTVQKILQNKDVSIRFVPAEGDPAQVVVVGGPYRFTGDPWNLQLQVKNSNDLDPKRLYSGHLAFEYPDLEAYWVQATPKQIDIQFDKAEPPVIYDMRPKDGQVFIAGKAINFYVETLRDAKVRWDFGNGDTAQGHEVLYTYNTACEPEVTVTVTSDPRIGATTKQVEIEVVDLGVSIDPFDGVAYEGHPFNMTCTARGPIERYEWFVDSVKYDGADRSDVQGSALAYTFTRSGQHLISVNGIAQRGTVSSEERRLEVGAKPEVKIVSPPTGTVAAPGDSVEFRADVKGNVETVTWVLRDAQTKALILESSPTAVAKDGSTKFGHAFPETDGERKVEVIAQGQLGASLSGQEVLSLPTEISLLVTGDLEIIAPVKNEALFRRAVSFKASRSGKVSAVNWQLYRAGEAKPFHEATGDAFDYSFPQEVGQEEMSVTVVARGELPGAALTAPPEKMRELLLRSPDLNPRLQLPVDDQGVERTSFGLNERIQPRLEVNDDIGSITWDFGDGPAETSQDPNPIHSYTNYGTYQIGAVVMSKWTEIPVAAPPRIIKIEQQEAKADFAIMLGGDEVERAPWRSIVRLEDRSSGDVMGRQWFVDGEELTGQQNAAEVEYTCSKFFGSSSFELRVLDMAGAVASEKALSLRVTNRWVFWAILLCLVGPYVVVARLLLGNQPKKWRIACSVDGAHFERPRALVGEYWSAWRKEARIPLGRVFNKSQHWKKGAGRDTKLIVRVLGKQKGALDGNVEISHYSDPAVTWDLSKSSGQTKDYSLIDGRADEGEKYSDVYIRLVKTVSSGMAGILASLFIGLLFASLGFIGWYLFW